MFKLFRESSLLLGRLALRRLDHMTDQHAGGHGADTAGHRGDGGGDGLRLFEADVADVFLSVPIDAHIQHGRAGGDEILRGQSCGDKIVP